MDIRELIPKHRIEKIVVKSSPLKTIGLTLMILPVIIAFAIYLAAILTGNVNQLLVDMFALLAVLALAGALLHAVAQKPKDKHIINGEFVFPIVATDEDNVYLTGNDTRFIKIPRERINDYIQDALLKKPQIAICGRLHHPTLTLQDTVPEDK